MKNSCIVLLGLFVLCTFTIVNANCNLKSFNVPITISRNVSNYAFAVKNYGKSNVMLVPGNTWGFLIDSSLAVPAISVTVDELTHTINMIIGSDLTIHNNSNSNNNTIGNNGNNGNTGYEAIKTGGSSHLAPSVTVLLAGLALVFGSNKRGLLFLGIVLCVAATAVMAFDGCNTIIITYPDEMATMLGSKCNIKCMGCEYSEQSTRGAEAWVEACVPIVTPTTQPGTCVPTKSPTSTPSPNPATAGPTKPATGAPTSTPSTQNPTKPATASPTQGATQQPTQGATQQPTQGATQQPTQGATQQPTQGATRQPTQGATRQPTQPPTQPATSKPTTTPTTVPTIAPTVAPTAGSTVRPTAAGTTKPSTGFGQLLMAYYSGVSLDTVGDGGVNALAMAFFDPTPLGETAPCDFTDVNTPCVRPATGSGTSKNLQWALNVFTQATPQLSANTSPKRGGKPTIYFSFGGQTQGGACWDTLFATATTAERAGRNAAKLVTTVYNTIGKTAYVGFDLDIEETATKLPFLQNFVNAFRENAPYDTYPLQLCSLSGLSDPSNDDYFKIEIMRKMGPAQNGINFLNMMVANVDLSCSGMQNYWMHSALDFIPPANKIFGMWGELLPSWILHEPGCASGSSPLFPMMKQQGVGIGIWQWWSGPTNNIINVFNQVRSG